jgi:hypothetical protein
MHFSELLSSEHQIELSYPSLYRLLAAEGVKSPKTKRRYKPHRRRERRAQTGLLLQMDATPFAWFDGDRTLYSLHGAIDDATGQVTGLYMTKNECLHGYFELLRRTIENYGIPMSVYADRHTIFQVPGKETAGYDTILSGADTQFGRCLKELSVVLIAAKSPQAKGRVERLWGTLQSRLPVEFAIRKVKTMDEANSFLKTYIYDFNAIFAVEPKQTQNAFRKPGEDEILDHIICVKEQRSLDAGGVFSYRGKSFKIIDGDVPLPAKTKIDALISSRIGIMAAYKGRVMETLPFVPPKRQKKTTPKKEHAAFPPASDHAWRKDGMTINSATISERKYEKREEYYDTIRLIEKTRLGKCR